MTQSETVTIKRSQINLNPFNPKNHTDEQIAFQKKNLKKVGYLGGVIWNSESQNLIDGHRRIKAMDLIYHYDGTAETDYDVKVERVQFDEQTEKEQMTYQAVGNSKADYNLIAEYIDDVDYHNIGISEEDWNLIKELRVEDDELIEDIPDMGSEFLSTPTPKAEEKPKVEEIVTPRAKYELKTEDTKTIEDIQKEHAERVGLSVEEVKEKKAKARESINNYQGETTNYVLLNFESEDAKRAFCELMDVAFAVNVVVSGEEMMERFDM